MKEAFTCFCRGLGHVSCTLDNQFAAPLLAPYPWQPSVHGEKERQGKGDSVSCPCTPSSLLLCVVDTSTQTDTYALEPAATIRGAPRLHPHICQTPTSWPSISIKQLIIAGQLSVPVKCEPSLQISECTWTCLVLRRLWWTAGIHCQRWLCFYFNLVIWMIQVQGLSRAWDYINTLVLRVITFSMFHPCVHTNAESSTH